MDRDEQIRAILRRLAGEPSGSLPPLAAFDGPFRTIYRLAMPCASRTEAAGLVTILTAEMPGGDRLRREILAAMPPGGDFAPHSRPTQDAASPAPSGAGSLRYPSLRDVPRGVASVHWLWPSWVPHGTVTLLAAAPGVGKSLVALDLARRIVQGDPFPDGAPVPQPGSPVLLVDAEGSLGLLRQRVDAWQIDPGLLYLMNDPRSVSAADLGTLDGLKRLLDMCVVIRPALVIVDSLASAAQRSETSVKAAREILGSLSRIADTLDTAVLVIHHLRKRHPASAFRPPSAADLRGSSHLTAVARSILLLSPEGPAGGLVPVPDPNGPRRLAVVKSNLCPLPPPLSLALEVHPGAPLLCYTPLVELPPPPIHLDNCAQWLLGFLAAAAPVRPSDVVTAARRAGFSRPTLYRARHALGPAVLDLGGSPHDPRKHWSLAP